MIHIQEEAARRRSIILQHNRSLHCIPVEFKIENVEMMMERSINVNGV